MEIEKQIVLYEKAAAGLPDSGDLPPLTTSLLDQLETRITHWSFYHPRTAVALSRVVTQTASHTTDAFNRGRAAFLSGLAALAVSEPRPLFAAAKRARAHFLTAQEPGWVAACDWLRCAQPWLTSDFHEAIAVLQKTRPLLTAHGLDHLLPDCDLALAYAHVLIGAFRQATDLFRECEAAFVARSPEDEAHWLLHVIVISIASHHHEQNKQQLARLETLLNSNRPGFLWGKYLYRRAVSRYQIDFELDQADQALRETVHQFQSLDLPVWEAQARQYHAQLLADLGHLSAAQDNLQQARAIFVDQGLEGLAANNTHDLSWIALLSSRYETAAAWAGDAVHRYEALRLPAQAASSRTNIGMAYEKMGDFQEALIQYERALEVLQATEFHSHKFEILDRIAQLWTRLGNLEQGQAALADMAPLADNPRLKARLLGQEAALHQKAGEMKPAGEKLEQALALFSVEQDPLFLAGHYLALAQLRLELDEIPAAGQALEKARELFGRYQLDLELATCSLVEAHLHLRRGELAAARHACFLALELNDGVQTDLSWEVKLLLTDIALRQNEPATAVSHYAASLDAGEMVTDKLWQPDIADHLLAARGRLIAGVLEKMAPLAGPALLFRGMLLARTHNVLGQLPFMASTFQLEDPEVEALEAELRFLQGRLMEASTRLAILRINQQRRAKALALARRRRQLERATYDGPRRFTTIDQEAVRRTLAGRLGRNWIALTLHQTDRGLIRHLLTPDSASVTFISLDESEQTLLARFNKVHTAGDPLLAEGGRKLGRRLFPEEILEGLSGETLAFIVPHGELFHLPWPALITGRERPLVEICVPCVLPTWQDLVMIWERPPLSPSLGRGVVLAITAFDDRFPPLPAARSEARQLQTLIGEEASVWLDEAATWSRLRQHDFSGSSFLHCATHTTHDSQSGYLSGLVLADGEIWHQRLLQAAPLPPLITLATCSGIRGFVQAGSAHQGLATSFLAAGARAVIGSLWPVPDALTADLILDFYAFRRDGEPPARALALAQRQALGRGSAAWQGFLCFGSPL